MGVLRNTLLWGSQNKWLERQFRRRRFAKRAVARFMPGETPEDALQAADGLERKNIGTIVTCLGENVEELEAISEVAALYTDLLTRIADRRLDTHVSVKLTHLGLDLDRTATREHLERLTARAAELGNFVWVDMESSAYVDATLAIYAAVRQAHANIGVCVQAYLHRTAQDLDGLLAQDATVRLVKGAYNEPPEVAFRRKRDVDENYFALGARLLRHPTRAGGPPHALATHDLALIARLRQEAQAAETPPDRYEFDMLYGIRSAEQLRLAGEGVPVRVLISYGEAWFAWYMRRLAERPANMGFVLRTMMAR